MTTESIPLTNLVPRHHSYIDFAVQQSLKSSMYHKHGAVLVYRNKVISYGYNHMIYHHICRKKQTNWTNGLYSIHAEVSAIMDFLKQAPRLGLNKKILKDCKLYVVRTGKESMDYPLKMSKPCENCIHFITKHKVKCVYWSLDEDSDSE